MELSSRADEVRITVATNLDHMLKAQRWTRRSAAAQLGLTHTYVNSRAAGTTDLSASDLVMFADLLEVPVARFFDAVPDDDGGNVTRIGGAGAGAGGRRSLYLLEQGPETSNVTV